MELTAHLCGQYGLDPLADDVVICHQEGYRRGVASNHGDVLHWFPRFGKSMDGFRADVAAELGRKPVGQTLDPVGGYAARTYRELVDSGASPFSASLWVSQLLGHERPDVTRVYLAFLGKGDAQ